MASAQHLLISLDNSIDERAEAYPREARENEDSVTLTPCEISATDDSQDLIFKYSFAEKHDAIQFQAQDYIKSNHENCPIIYHCEMQQSSESSLPWSIDLCSLTLNDGRFDEKIGNFQFWSTDQEKFPPGHYQIKITGSTVTEFDKKDIQSSNSVILKIELTYPVEIGRRLQTCDDPTSISPSSLIEQAYTITDNDKTYQFPAFVTDPPGCPVNYVYQASPSMVTQAITFDQATRTFTFSYSNDLSLAMTAEESYTITVTGSVGTTTSQETSASFVLKMRNPCFDNTFVSILTQPLTNRNYIINNLDTWFHTPFEIQTSPITHTLCGSLTYTATFDGSVIGSMDQPMSYKTDLSFTFFSADSTYTGVFEYSLSANLVDYPTNATPNMAETASITIADPCDDAVSLTASTLDDQMYTITEQAKTYQFPAFQTDPTQCTVTYTYSVVPEPSSAIVQFDGTARQFTFSNESDRSLVGQYEIIVTGTFGTNTVQSAQQSFLLNVSDPCADTNFIQIAPSTISETSYVIGDPAKAFTHDEFTVVTTPITHSLCGSLSYTADLSMQTLSPSTVPMSYDETTRTFSVYSEDINQANSYIISLTAYFTDVPNGMVMGFLMHDFEIVIPDPCLNPVLTASSTVQQEYTITDTELVYELAPFVVDPPDCVVTYEITFDGGVTGSSVDATPTFRLYNDQNNDILGLVEFHVTGTSGSAQETAIIVVNILDPCVDPLFVALDLASLDPSYTYILGQNAPDGILITHDALSVTTTPTQHTLCGAVAYMATVMSVVVLGPTDVPMSYDGTTRTIQFYSDDTQFVGDAPFVIMAYLVDYPDRFVQIASQLSVIEDPCAIINSISPSTMVQQEYTITDTAKTYQFDPFITDPPDCPATYTYLVSPGAAADVITFDDSTRTFTFFNDQDVSIAMDTAYAILITGTAGDQSVQTLPPLLLMVKNPCIDANFVTIDITSLDASYSYTLGHNEPDGIQITNDVLNVNTTPIQHTLCGEVAYEATSDGLVVGPSDEPMSYDGTTQTLAFYSIDVQLVGDKPFTIKAYLVNYPDRFLEISSFITIIEGPCSFITTLLPSTMIDQEYTITDVAKTYQLTPWTIDPPDCQIAYTYSVVPSDATAAISFDDQTLTFTFYYDQDVSLASDSNYIITITGKAGSISSVVDFTDPPLYLMIKNPCLDSNFVSIQTSTLANEYLYGIGSPAMFWTHDDFSVNLSICGTLTYTVTFMGNNVDPTTTPMTYDASAKLFSVETSDPNLIGQTHEFVLSASLTNYPEMVIPDSSISATVTFACTTVNSILPSVMESQEYTISDTAKTYQFLEFQTDPPGCPVTYTYLVNPGGTVADAISFDEPTRTFTFYYDQDVSIAMDTPYGILITGEAGTDSPVTAQTIPPLLLTIKDPCIDTNYVTLDFPGLDASYTYILGKNAPDGIQIIHDVLSVITTPTQHTLCGEIAYEATSDGLVVGPSDAPMSYDGTTQTLAFYSEDVLLVGDKLLTFKAYLVNYPDRFLEISSVLTVMIDPCASPALITASIMEEQEYTIAEPAKTYQFLEFQTDPPDCPVTYTYLVSPGAAADVITFDETTRTFTFFYDLDVSIAMDTPYAIMITGTTGTEAPQSAQTMPPLLLMIKDPCIEPGYATIQITPLVNQQYGIGGPAMSWTHDEFSMAPSLCGTLTYTATYEGNSVDLTTSPMTYDSTTRQFSLLQSDLNLVGQTHEFILSASLTNYPDLVIPDSSVTGAVEYVLDCKTLTSITASAMVPQEYTITDTAITYQFEPFTTDPPGCPITYTYLVNPGGDGINAISFDEPTRTFTFYYDQDVSIAMDTPYGIMITGTAGSETPQSVQTMPPLLLTLKNPCIDANFVTLSAQPLTPQPYFLFDQSYTWTHDAFIVNTTPIQHNLCGELTYVATFMGNAVSQLTEPVNYDQATLSFTIYSEDTNLVGVQEYSLSAFLTNYETVVSDTMTEEIQIDDACLDKNLITISMDGFLQNQSYTITDAPKSYQIPSISVNPARCELILTLDVDPLLSDTVSFDSNSQTFTFNNDFDVTVSGSGSELYDVFVIATSGQVTESYFFELTLRNPCVDPFFVEFEVTYMADVIYRIDDPPVSFTHEPVTLITYPFQHNLCGELAYDGVWYNNYIGTGSSPLAYDWETKTFTFESFDTADEGLHDVVVEAYLIDYPTDLWADIYGLLEVLPSCVNPVVFEASPQTQIIVDDYSGKLYFRMEDWYVDPFDCPITWTCEFLDGPRMDQDLCSLTDVSWFDDQWGDWYFYSKDMIEWPEGEYSFRITGTVGNSFDFHDLLIILANPCKVAEFEIIDFPFVNQVYTLGAPSITQSWIDEELFTVTIRNNEVDVSECGPIYVDFYDFDADFYFDVDFFTQDNNVFAVKETTDLSLVGIYNIGIWVYFFDYSEYAYAQSDEQFSIIITQFNCDDAIITSPAFESFEYTIGDPSFDYEFPSFSIEPTDCVLTYQYTVSGQGGDQLVTEFDANAQFFTFENMDNYNLSGSYYKTYKVTIIAVTGGLLGQNEKPASFNLRVNHPCQRADFTPNSLSVSPFQEHPDPYFYTKEAAFIQIESFVADPVFCPVKYECVDISGPSDALTCDDLIQVSNQVLTLQTYDMEKYIPGKYEITIDGSAGIINEVHAELIIELILENPCPTANLSNQVQQPFTDVIYLLGGEEIVQQVQKQGLVELDTKVDCGPLLYEFYTDNEVNLDSAYFFITDPQDIDTENLTFVVLQQNNRMALGEYLVRYRAYLQNYPDVQIESDDPFVVTIDLQTEVLDFSGIEIESNEPEWLSLLEDQEYQYGVKERFYYDFGEIQTQEFIEYYVQVIMDKAIQQAFSYDQQMNRLRVNGYQFTEGMIGSWDIVVTVFMSPEIDQNASYVNSFTVTILPAKVEEKEEIDPIEEITKPIFTGMVVLTEQEQEEEKVRPPLPYIVSISSTGIVTIGWSVSMKMIDDPKLIPTTKVGVKSDLLKDQSDLSGNASSTRRRQLASSDDTARTSDSQKAWYQDSEINEEISLNLLDALEVKFISNDLDLEEENMVQQSIEWDLIDFTQDFIKVQLNFEQPEEIGGVQKKDYIQFTFWGVELFQDQEGNRIELGKTIQYEIQRQVNQDKAGDIQQLNNVMDGALIAVAAVFIVFIGLGGRLLPTWMFLNSLQLIVHLPLLSTTMPSNLHFFLVKYLNFIRMKADVIDEQIEIWQRKYGLQGFLMSQNDDSTYSPLFLLCGYKPIFSQNLFLIALISAVLLTVIIACTLIDMICQRRGNRRIAFWVTNFGVRFLYEFFFEIFLCMMIHTASMSPSSNAQWALALLVLIFVIVFIAFLVSRLFIGGPYIKNSYAKGSLWASFWGIRVLSDETLERYRFQEHSPEKDAMKKVEPSPILIKQANQDEEDCHTARNLLKIEQQQPVEQPEETVKLTPENDLITALGLQQKDSPQNNNEKSEYEGGQEDQTPSQQEPSIDCFYDEAKIRNKLKEEVNVCSAYKTLFYGLKWNHQHNVAALHPILFVFRRIIYSMVIIFMIGESVIFGAMILILSTLFMLIFVATEKQWEEKFVNWQHLANEAIIYVYCLALMVFSGVLTKTGQSQAFGVTLIAMTVLLVCFNVAYIVFDLIIFIKLLACRYGLILKQNLILNRNKMRRARKIPRNKIKQVSPEIPKLSFDHITPEKPDQIPIFNDEINWPNPQSIRQQQEQDGRNGKDSFANALNDVGFQRNELTDRKGSIFSDKLRASLGDSDCKSPERNNKVSEGCVELPMIPSGQKLLMSAGHQDQDDVHGSGGRRSMQSSQIESMIQSKKEWLQQLMLEDAGSPDVEDEGPQETKQNGLKDKFHITNVGIEGSNDVTLRTNSNHAPNARNKAGSSRMTDDQLGSMPTQDHQVLQEDPAEAAESQLEQNSKGSKPSSTNSKIPNAAKAVIGAQMKKKSVFKSSTAIDAKKLDKADKWSVESKTNGPNRKTLKDHAKNQVVPQSDRNLNSKPKPNMMKMGTDMSLSKESLSGAQTMNMMGNNSMETIAGGTNLNHRGTELNVNSSMVGSEGLPQNTSHEGVGPFLPGSQSFEAYNTMGDISKNKKGGNSNDPRRASFANTRLDTSNSQKGSSSRILTNVGLNVLSKKH